MVRKRMMSLWIELTTSSVARLSPACVLSPNHGSASTCGGRSGSASGLVSSSLLNTTPYWWGRSTHWHNTSSEPLKELEIIVYDIFLCQLKCFKCAKDLQPLLEMKLAGCQVVYKSKHSKKMQHELKVVGRSDTLILGFQSCSQAEEWRKVWYAYIQLHSSSSGLSISCLYLICVSYTFVCLMLV